MQPAVITRLDLNLQFTAHHVRPRGFDGFAAGNVVAGVGRNSAIRSSAISDHLSRTSTLRAACSHSATGSAKRCEATLAISRALNAAPTSIIAAYFARSSADGN